MYSDTTNRSVLVDGATKMQGRHLIRVAFVTNMCPHYRVKTFETIAQSCDVKFFFYSDGDEWYWQEKHGVRRGNFHHIYLPAFHLTRRIRIVPSLLSRLVKADYDAYVKCINGRFALPMTYFAARLRRKPFILWTGIWMSLDTPFHRLIFPLTRWIYRNADAIVVYGEHVKRYLYSLDILAEKIFVAAHAVDNSEYNRPITVAEKATLKEKLNLSNERAILYLGRLEAMKGVNYLIEAFSGLNCVDAILVIVGDGSLRKELVELAVRKGVREKIRFVGYASPDEARIYYAVADVFVLPSITLPTGKEPWGLVVNEAMNQGVPVVATDAVGAAAGGLVQDGVNGFVVPERDSAALAQAIDRILADSRLRKQMSQNARKIISDWNNERMVQGFRQAIEYAMQRRS
jgi:glycosyltransferase involved in cell wall biosynthesis